MHLRGGVPLEEGTPSKEVLRKKKIIILLHWKYLYYLFISVFTNIISLPYFWNFT